MLSNYKLKISDLYNISIGNVEKLVSSFFHKKDRCFIMKSYRII